jgi:hypothetical protein
LRLQAVNAAGQPVSSVNEGETFFLNVYAADLRPSGQGVFSAYLDVAYDAAALTAAGPVQFGAGFPNVRAGSTVTPGWLDEIGAVGAAKPDGASDPLLATVPFTATAPGQYALQANPADVLPAGQVTLWGIDGPIPSDKVEYGTANITVVRVDGDGDGVTDPEEDGAPNAGDANRDGTADRLQNRVASVRSLSGNLYATFAAASPVVLSDTAAVPNPAPASAPANIQFPLGFFQLNAGGLSAAAATTVTVLLQPGAVANAYYRYGPTSDNASPHWYPFMFDGVTGAIIHSDRIEVRLVEGQRGDDNLAGAGLAFGPGGPGLSSSPWVNPRNSLDANNSGDVTALDVLTLINEINRTGARVLPAVPATGETLPPYLDTNGDNVLEAADVLNIVNWLNSAAAGEGEGTVTNATLQDLTRPPVWPFPAERVSSPVESGPLSPSRSAHGALVPGRQDTSDGTVWSSPAADSPDNPMRPRRAASSLPTIEEGDLEQSLDEIAADVAREWGV